MTVSTTLSLLCDQSFEKGFNSDIPSLYYDLLYEEVIKLLSLSDKWEQVLTMQEQYDQIELRMPNITDREFTEYICLGDMLAIFYVLED